MHLCGYFDPKGAYFVFVRFGISNNLGVSIFIGLDYNITEGEVSRINIRKDAFAFADAAVTIYGAYSYQPG